MSEITILLTLDGRYVLRSPNQLGLHWCKAGSAHDRDVTINCGGCNNCQGGTNSEDETLLTQCRWRFAHWEKHTDHGGRRTCGATGEDIMQCNDPSGAEDTTATAEPVSPRARPMRHLVITVHGIRTFGQWQERLENLTKNTGQRDRHVEATFAHYKYNYFSVLALLMPVLCWIEVWRFRRQLLWHIDKGPWDRISIVAHSFGTYVVAQSLMSLPLQQRPKIHTLILAGSVLQSTYPWHRLLGDCVLQLINDCGTKDSVLLLSQLFVPFMGMAGREGFVGSQIGGAGTGSYVFRNRYFVHSHSGYFQTEGDWDDAFMKQYWVPLLTADHPPGAVPDPRRLTSLHGLWIVLLRYADLAKLAFYGAPFVLLWYTFFGFYGRVCAATLRVEILVQQLEEAQLQTAEQRQRQLLEMATWPQAEPSSPMPYTLTQPPIERQLHQLATLVSEAANKSPFTDRTLPGTLLRAGDLLQVAGHLEEAQAAYEYSVLRFGWLAGSEPQSIQYRRGHTIALTRLGCLLIQQDAVEAAKQQLDRALINAQQAYSAAASDPEAVRDYWALLVASGNAMYQRDMPAEAVHFYTQALGLLENGATSTVQAVSLRDRSLTYRRLALAHLKLGKDKPRSESLTTAKEFATRSLATVRELQDDSPPARRERAITLSICGQAELYAQQLTEAQQHLEESFYLADRLAAEMPRRVDLQLDAAAACFLLAELAEARGDSRAAATAYGRTIEKLQSLEESGRVTPLGAGRRLLRFAEQRRQHIRPPTTQTVGQ